MAVAGRMLALLALLLAVLVAVAVQAHPNNLDQDNMSIASDEPRTSAEARQLRLIQYGPRVEHTAWLLPFTIDALAVRGLRFFDITDHKDSYRRPEALAHARALASYPVTLRQQAFVRSCFSGVTGDAIRKTVEWLSTDFYNRHYTTADGERAVHELASKYEEAAGARLGQDVEALIVLHNWRQPSLVVRVKGASRPDEVVILGGHIDSIAGSGAASRAPGADDDGSGSACVLQVFRALMQKGYRPERTIEFHAYAAEEIGLRGSQDVAETYLKTQVKVHAMLNLDLTGFNRQGANAPIGLYTDFVDTGLTNFIKLVLSEYSALPWEATKCGYGCSDHASWTKVGFPSAHFGEGTQANINPYIHSDRDTVDRLDPHRAQEIARASLGYIVELGSNL